MSNLPAYSTLFSTLYDEQKPIGRLGRGTHYSVLRAVEWMNVTRENVGVPQLHDFSIVWDEDHDTRVIEAVEKIYKAGLLAPVQFIGERKGGLTVIVAARFYFFGTGSSIEEYESYIEEISSSLDDYWSVSIGSFDRSAGSAHQCFPKDLISDREDKVITYLKNIDSLWSLGTRNFDFM